MSTARTSRGLASYRIDVLPVGGGYYQSAHFAKPGDSGGPVYVGSGSHRRIIAVLSGGNDEVETLARVDVLSELIEKTISETENDNRVSEAVSTNARPSAPAWGPPASTRASTSMSTSTSAKARKRALASADPGY